MREAAGSGEMNGGAERPARGAELRAWALVALWILVIFAFSQAAFSAEFTRSRLAPLMRLLGLEYETVVMIHFFIRKGAHVLEYAVLGYLALRAASLSTAGPAAVFLPLVLALLVAGADELHQATVWTRTGTPRDVALDFVGAGIGVALRARRRVGASAAGKRPTVSGSEGEAR